MAAGLSVTVMDWTRIIETMDSEQRAKKRGPHKKLPAKAPQSQRVVHHVGAEGVKRVLTTVNGAIMLGALDG